MLSVFETSVFQVNRFFDKLRMTSKLDFLDSPFFIIHQQKKQITLTNSPLHFASASKTDTNQAPFFLAEKESCLLKTIFSYPEVSG